MYTQALLAILLILVVAGGAYTAYWALGQSKFAEPLNTLIRIGIFALTCVFIVLVLLSVIPLP